MPLHPPTLHLAVVALPVAAILVLVARRRAAVGEAAAWAVHVAAVGAVLASVTGIIAHEPYEHTAVADEITVHQFLSLATTVGALVASVWLTWGRQVGKDPVPMVGFQGLLVVLATMVLVTATLGGELVYEHGVGVIPPDELPPAADGTGDG